jgi:hypothetical protein
MEDILLFIYNDIKINPEKMKLNQHSFFIFI